MKNKFIVVALSALLIISVPGVSCVYALDAPDKPTIEDTSNNDSIREYNQKVKKYNQQVDEYNKNVDAEYESAVKSVTEKNNEIKEHNESETERVAAQTAQNEQAVAEAQAQNETIAKTNAENKAKAEAAKQRNQELLAKQEAENKAEDERVALANQAEDNRVQDNIEHNKQEEAKYAEKYAQYEKDKIMAEKILKAGYESVDAYNQVAKHYNESAAKSREKNPQYNITESAVNVEEAEEKSGVTYNVTIKHVYSDANGDLKVREEVLTVDRNDIVTVGTDAVKAEATEENSATFYSYIDDNHLQGYWAESWSEFIHTALYAKDGWNCGETHTFSYKDGSKYNQFDDIDITYYYQWIPLGTAKTYNTPVEPTKDLWDVTPKYETPQYVVYELEDETYTEIPYVEAQTIEVVPADIWEMMSEPEKQEYLEHLSELEFQKDPSKPVVVIVTPIPVNEGTNDVTPNDTSTNIEANTVPAVHTDANIADITDNATPKVVIGSWALLNLICVFITFVLCLICIVQRKDRDEGDDSDEDDSEKRKIFWSQVVSIITCLTSTVVFVLTENIKLPMVIVDKYTLYMLIFTLVNIVDTLQITKRANKDKDNDI